MATKAELKEDIEWNLKAINEMTEIVLNRGDSADYLKLDHALDKARVDVLKKFGWWKEYLTS